MKNEIKEQPANFYSARYFYGYDWNCYRTLAVKMIEIMKMTGCKDKKTLDVGTGIGWFADFYYFNVSRNVKGIDFSKRAIWFHAKKLYPAIEFECADIYNYDYTGYKVLMMMEVLEHIEKDIELITKFPQGSQIYATVPFEKERMDVSHVREYTLESAQKRYEKLIDIKMCIKFEQFIILWGVKK